MNNTTEIRTFLIPTSRLPEFDKRAEKYGRKAAAMGFDFPGYTTDGTEVRKVQLDRDLFVKVEFTRVVVPMVRISWAEGSRLIARVEYSDGRNIVTYVPGAEDLLQDVAVRGYFDRIATAAPVCDHCSINARRKVGYVVVLPDGGLMTLGSSCVKGYTGLSPESITGFMIAGAGFADDIPWGREDLRLRTDKLVSLAFRVVREIGYVKASEGGYGRPAPTKWMLLDALEMPADKQDETYPPLDSDPAEAALDWLRSMDSADISSGYMRTLQDIALSEYVNPDRYAGFIASIPSAWDRECGKRVEDQRRAEATAELVDAPYAEDKQRCKGVTVTLTGLRYLESSYNRSGVVTLCRLVTDSGHVLNWWTESEPWDTDDLGKQYVIDFTVKTAELNRYESLCVTKILRVKVVRS